MLLSNWFQERLIWLPVMVVFGYQLGRGVGNTLLGCFALVATIVLIQRRSIVFYQCKSIAIVYFAFVCVYIASTLVTPTAVENSKYLLAYIFASLVLLQLQVYPRSVGVNMLKPLGWIALLAGASFAVQFVVVALSKGEGFVPSNDVNGMVVAVLFPWLMLLSGKYRCWIAVGVLVLLFASDSRTEVLAALASIAIYIAVIKRKVGWLMTALPLVFFLVLGLDAFISGRSLEGPSMYDLLNDLSSRRLTLWEKVIPHIPFNSAFGEGAYASVGAGFVPSARHFHNAFLEMWYEMGTLGIGLFMILVGKLGKLAYNCYCEASGESLRTFAILCSAFTAVIVSLSLDKAMHSVFGRFYLFYVMGLFYLWAYPAYMIKNSERS